MKLIATVLVCLSALNPIIAGEDANTVGVTKDLKREEAKELRNQGYKINTKVFKFGASLGFNYLSKNLYDPVLSITDNSLKLEEINPMSFLASTTITINPIQAYYRKLDANGKAEGNVYTRDFPISFIATVNFAQFGSSQTASFNKKIDGGLGLGIKLSDDFHIGFTMEMISNRQLRGYFKDEYLNKPIQIGEETLNALDIKDDRIFVDRYNLGFSLKFIYILVENKSN